MLGLLVATCAHAAVSRAGTVCAVQLLQPLNEVHRAIDVLRADARSPGRLIAPNGKTYTVEQAGLMREELQMIDDACRHGREVEATWRVEGLQAMLGTDDSPDPRNRKINLVTARRMRVCEPEMTSASGCSARLEPARAQNTAELVHR